MSQTTTTGVSTATTTPLPTTMRAWQWTTCTTTLESAIRINESAPLPTSHHPLSAGESLIRVYAATLNQVDYKFAELPLISRLAIRKPATPGLDFAGRIVSTGPDCGFKVGQMVFGKLEPKSQFGTLGEYVVGSRKGTVSMPEGVEVEGGTGTFAVQIAKALGCHVTATCSGANVQLCKDLGADEVIDYRKNDVAAVLASGSKQYDMILDNVGHPSELYWKAPAFTKPGAKYVQVGSQVSLSFLYDLAFRFLVPTWLGGGQRPFSFGFALTNFDDFTALGKLVESGKVKPVIDEVYEFEDVPKAYQKLRTGRARGKIVVRMSQEKY
ncbi:NADPH:quinone reductase-like protein [Bipolaris maydis]|nr:NADPH:quinone reductase-like protein [Bipolaris maydis]